MNGSFHYHGIMATVSTTDTKATKDIDLAHPTSSTATAITVTPTTKKRKHTDDHTPYPSGLTDVGIAIFCSIHCIDGKHVVELSRDPDPTDLKTNPRIEQRDGKWVVWGRKWIELAMHLLNDEQRGLFANWQYQWTPRQLLEQAEEKKRRLELLKKKKKQKKREYGQRTLCFVSSSSSVHEEEDHLPELEDDHSLPVCMGDFR